MKKAKLGIIIVVILLFSIYLFIKHQQLPISQDVYAITTEWAPPITEVYTVQKVGGDWITFFSSNQMLFVGKIEQNWLGNWKLQHPITGEEQPIGSTSLDLINEKGIVVGVGGISRATDDVATYFFGMIENPNVEKVVITTEAKTIDNIPFIVGNGERFFLYEKNGDPLPYQFKLIDKNGRMIYEGQ